MIRPSKEDYYLGIAEAVSKRSTCLRSAYGAVIVLDDRIVGTGYNGSARGLPNCSDTGKCGREGIPTRERYELCRAVHAEQNAVINARCNLSGATIYIAGSSVKTGESYIGDKVLPCAMCYRALVNAGVSNLVIYALPPDNFGTSWVRIPLETLPHLAVAPVTEKNFNPFTWNF